MIPVGFSNGENHCTWLMDENINPRMRRGYTKVRGSQCMQGTQQWVKSLTSHDYALRNAIRKT